MNNPVKFNDPDGRVCGDFYDENGNYLGNDGINDGKVYILKTFEKSFGEGANTVSGAGLIQTAGSRTHYVMGCSNGTTYIYNAGGVQATIPTKKFIKIP